MASRVVQPVLLSLGLALALALPAPSEASPAWDGAPASGHRATGDAALAAGQLERARKAYSAALAERPTFDIAGNLGAICLALGKRRQAAENLALALAHFPADGSDELRRGLESRFAEAAAHVATIHVSAEPAGAEVLVDGSSVGLAPLALPLFLEPGDHAVELVAGTSRTARPVSAVAGEEQRIRVVLEPVAADPPPSGIVDSGPDPFIIAAGLGLTVAAGAVGAAFAVAAANEDSAAAEQGAALDHLRLPDPCGSYPGTCDDIRAKQDSRDSFTVVAGVGLGVAGAALAATVLYGLLGGAPSGDARHDSDTSVLLLPTWTERSRGAAVRMRW